MRSILLAAGILATGVATQTPVESPLTRFVNPPTLSTPTGYTHVVEVNGGRTIYIAGQVALDREGKLVGAGDFRAQATQVFENLQLALAAAGATFEHVVKMNTYVTDMSQLQGLREVRSRYVGARPPAHTLVQVVRLAREELLLEIEAVAVLPQTPGIRRPGDQGR